MRIAPTNERQQSGLRSTVSIGEKAEVTKEDYASAGLYRRTDARLMRCRSNSIRLQRAASHHCDAL